MSRTLPQPAKAVMSSPDDRATPHDDTRTPLTAAALRAGVAASVAANRAYLAALADARAALAALAAFDAADAAARRAWESYIDTEAVAYAAAERAKIASMRAVAAASVAANPSRRTQP